MGARQRIATANQAAFKVQQMVTEEPQQGLLVDNPEAGNFHFIKAHLRHTCKKRGIAGINPRKFF